MLFRTYYPNMVDSNHTKEIVCPNCNNKTKHYIYEYYDGICFGTIFSSRPIIANKTYFFTCSICSNPTKNISLEEFKKIKKLPIKVCKNCGTTADYDSIFCSKCGKQLS